MLLDSDMNLSKAPDQELYSRAAPSVEAHHRVNGQDTEEIPEEGRKKKLLGLKRFPKNSKSFWVLRTFLIANGS